MKCPHCGEVYPNNRSAAVEYNGSSMSLKELAAAIGVPYPTVTGRWRRGDRGEKLIRPADEKYARKGLE